MTANLEPVREALEQIEEEIDIAPDEGEDFAGGAGWAGRREARPPKNMPEDCPVVPVGTEDGIFWFLTALGELRGLTADKVANKHIVAMFAPESGYLEEAWPRKKEIGLTDESGKPLLDKEGNKLKEWITVGWNTEIVSMLLMDCCAQRGVWNAREKVRGRGAWRADDGSLVLHCGNAVLMHGRWEKPGMHGAMVYPTQPAIPKPMHAGNVTADQIAPRLARAIRERGIKLDNKASPAALLFALLRTWNWARPVVDPILALGWIVMAPFGGAIDYRPIAWITGGRGTGKTSLLKVIAALANGALLQSPNATEAAVRQVLGQQSLPVNLDESEADKDNRKLAALVTLARLAATSQGNIIRGGQDHKATEFRATSCFLFSSILVPPLEPADRSRLALLELNRLPGGAKEIDWDVRELNAVGAWMLKRVADCWSRWPKLLDMFAEALMDHGGQGSRAADQFGTLRAAAELVLSDTMPDDEELMLWADLLSVRELAETSDAPEEGEMCLNLLRSRPVQLDMRGGQRLVSEWLIDAARPLPGSQFEPQYSAIFEGRAKAETALGRIGLKVVRYGPNDGKPKLPELWGTWLAVATNHVGLDQLLRDTKFDEGVWSQALGRLPGAIKSTDNKLVLRFAGHSSKLTLVPIDVALPRGDDDEEAAAEAEAEAERV